MKSYHSQHLNNLECVREDQFKAAKSKENVSKNRYQDILPCK